MLNKARYFSFVIKKMIYIPPAIFLGNNFFLLSYSRMKANRSKYHSKIMWNFQQRICFTIVMHCHPNETNRKRFLLNPIIYVTLSLKKFVFKLYYHLHCFLIKTFVEQYYCYNCTANVFGTNVIVHWISVGHQRLWSQGC